MITGYPVMVIVVKAETNTFSRAKKSADDIGVTFCMMTARNNKMKYLIAIYF